MPSGTWRDTAFSGSPIFADLTGNGQNELIVEAAGGKMIAYTTNANGSLVEFQQYQALPNAEGQQPDFKSTPVVVNDPGVGMVILAATGDDENSIGTPNALEDGRVYAFNAVTGQILPGWPQTMAYPGPGITQDGVTGALTIGYLQGNNLPDVIVTNGSELVRAFEMNGSVLWTYMNDEAVDPGAVVADLNDDGHQEVILSSAMTPNPNGFYPGGGYITILNGADGSLLRRIHTGEAFFGSPVVADLFGDGRLEIIDAPGAYLDGISTLTPAQQQAARAAGNRIYAYFPNGTLVPGFPYHTTTNDLTDHQTWKEVAVADLYGNGQNEIIDVDRQGVLHVVLPTGQDAPGFVGGIQLDPSVPFVENTGGDDWNTPIVADVTGSGQQDIIVARLNYLAVYSNHGQLIWSTSEPGTIFGAAAYGQFTPNGPPVLAVVLDSVVSPEPPQSVMVYQLPTTSTAPAWPELRRNSEGQAIAYSTTYLSSYVTKAYKALFGRSPAAGELSYQVNAITSGQITPFTLAQKLVAASEGSPRFPGLLNVSNADTTAKVTALYQSIGITSVPVDSMVAILYEAHRGASYASVAAAIVGSNGNYAATTSVASWAYSAYRDIFNVDPSPSIVAGIVGQLDEGEAMGDVVKGLLNSSAVRDAYVNTEVEAMLGRAATASDDATLAIYPQREDVIVAIASGAEFWNKSGGTALGFVNAIYTDLVGFAPPSSVANTLAGEINSRALTTAGLAPSWSAARPDSFISRTSSSPTCSAIVPTPRWATSARISAPPRSSIPTPVR